MWKEDEPGTERINHARAQEIKSSGADIVAANCPFCITMLQDGLQSDEEKNVMVFDLSELIVQQLN
jgi:Fe-S oxidoreductase